MITDKLRFSVAFEISRYSMDSQRVRRLAQKVRVFSESNTLKAQLQLHRAQIVREKGRQFFDDLKAELKTMIAAVNTESGGVIKDVSTILPVFAAEIAGLVGLTVTWQPNVEAINCEMQLRNGYAEKTTNLFLILVSDDNSVYAKEKATGLEHRTPEALAEAILTAFCDRL